MMDRIFFYRPMIILLDEYSRESEQKKWYFIKQTKKYSTNLNCVDYAVDKLSNTWKHNLFLFTVDKTYTLIVYFVYEVNKPC
jgi:hypothetical protein